MALQWKMPGNILKIIRLLLQRDYCWDNQLSLQHSLQTLQNYSDQLLIADSNYAPLPEKDGNLRIQTNSGYMGNVIAQVIF